MKVMLNGFFLTKIMAEDQMSPSSTIADGPENVTLTSPQVEHFEEGSTVAMSCSADSRPLAFYFWFLNGDKLSDSGPELRLMNIQLYQSGNYSCQAFNNKTLKYETSRHAAVHVHVLGECELGFIFFTFSCLVLSSTEKRELDGQTY